MDGETTAPANANGSETEASAAPATPAAPPARAAKLAAYRASSAAQTPGMIAKPAETAPSQTAAPAAPNSAAPADEAPDAQTAKALETIEKRDKRQREQLAAEQAAWKQQRELELAELHKAKNELGKAPTFDELKKLPPAKRALEAMRLAGLDPDDEEAMDLVARDTYARSKSGKADPKNRVYADQLQKEHGVDSRIAELQKQIEEMQTTQQQREYTAQLQRGQQQYLDEAVKAVPTTPNFFAKALAANPEKARSTLLALGQQMEREAMEAEGTTKYDPSFTPTHAQVLKRYEDDTRAELADRGFSAEQITAMLGAAAAPTKAPTAPPKTLDITTRPTTPTNTKPMTRDEKIAAARIERQKLEAQQQ